MKKTIICTIAYLLVATSLNAQNYEWAKSFGGTIAEFVRSITVDTSGNVYVTGYFQGTVDFDPGPGTANLTSVGDNDIYVMKMDALGQFIWAKSFGGSSNDNSTSISVDTSGNVYTIGTFAATVDLDPGPATAYFTSAGGSSDFFVQKLDSSGNFLWAKAFGSTSTDQGWDLIVDPSGNVYTTGVFNGIVDFNPGEESINLISNGEGDIFVHKMDASGNFVWAKSFGGLNGDYSQAMAIDVSGNIYTTGIFRNAVDFDPGSGTAILNSLGSSDIFVHKMDASGDFIWVRSFGGTSIDNVYSIDVDATGNVYTMGNFRDTVDFDPGTGTTNLTSIGNTDIFLQKLDASGNFLWAKSFGSTNGEIGNSISVDASGNVYTTGFFLETMDFDPGAGTANLTSIGYFDIFVQKIDASGDFVWAKSFGNTNEDVGYSIHVDIEGNVHTTGSFQGTVDFDPGEGMANLTTVGPNDIFVQKLNQDILGIPELGSGIKLLAYPNPSSGTFNISFEQSISNVEITLMDLQGKVIYNQKLNVVSNDTVEIEGSAGIYFLSVKTPNGQSVIKLIKK